MTNRSILFVATALLAAPLYAMEPAITAAQLGKLRAGVLAEKVKHGPTYHPGHELCRALKFPSNAKDPYKLVFESLYQVGPDGLQRSFAYSKQAVGYMLVLTTKSHIYYLSIDDAGLPVAGQSNKIRSSSEVMSDDEIAALVKQELGHWARFSDGMKDIP